MYDLQCNYRDCTALKVKNAAVYIVESREREVFLVGRLTNREMQLFRAGKTLDALRFRCVIYIL